MVNNTKQFIGSTLDIDIHPTLVDEKSIFYLMNGDVSDYSQPGNLAFIQNMASNNICYQFPHEYKYYGSIALDQNQHAIFISNGTLSQIVLLDTDNCVSKVIVQSDCLDFKSEISGVYKYYNGKRRFYWVEEGKSPKYLDECDIPYKRLTDCQECEDQYSKEIDCESMNFNGKVDFPCVKLEEGAGNLPGGVYQVAIAFTDDKTRFTNYYIYPEIIKLHSNDKRSFSINVEFEECFNTGFDQYELVLITHRIDRGTVAQRIGYFDTSQTDVLINNLDETFFTPIDLEVLLSERKYVYSAQDIAVNSESLILVGIEDTIDFDYRELACDINVEWVEMLVKASEAHKYYSFMRGEVYPIEIGFKLPNGQITHFTHIPNTNYGSNLNGVVATIFDNAPNNLDHPEASGNICNQAPKKYWEIYNTAEVTNVSNINSTECGPVERSSGTFGYWESRDNFYDSDYPCDLGCTPIRYHKMPDHKISHIHTNDNNCTTDICSEPYVNILTIRVSNVANPVDCDGNEIPVDGYIINVGDRTNHKSILHKGLIFNTANEDISCDEVSQYANYPFNDLQEDRFLTNELRRQGAVTNINYNGLNSYNHNKFTYHSPDIEYIKDQTGTELELYTEEIGRISGTFHNTETLPKYKILSPLARLAAQTVGIVEANLVLNGEKCTTVVTEQICKQIVDRRTEVNGFPTPNITGSAISGGATGTVTHLPLVAGSGGATGTVTHTNNSGGDITTNNPDTTDYSQTTIGDEPCDPNDPDYYTIQGQPEKDDASSGVIFQGLSALLGTLFNNEQDCKLVFDTNAEAGTVLVIQVDDNQYSGVVGSNGKVEIRVNADCDNLDGITFDDTNTRFTPACPCRGDKETKTIESQAICDARIDFLEDKEWFKMFPAMLFYYTQGVQATQNILKSIIKAKNYGIQATFTASYDSYNTESIILTNTRRLINNQQYLLPIKQYIGEEKFNNWCRTQANYYELNNNISPTCETDNSRVSYSDVFCRNADDNLDDRSCSEAVEFGFCNTDNKGDLIQAVSYYAGIKQYKPNQYGSLNNYRTRTVSCAIPLNESPAIYGGDVYISKHKTVRRMPFFTKLPLGLPNDTEFSYQDNPNIGIPRYWMDISQESAIEDIIEQVGVIGNFFVDYNLEGITELGKCGSGLNFLQGIGGIGSAFQWVTDLVSYITSLGDTGFTNPFKLSGVFYTHVTGIIEYYGESEFISNFREYNEVPNSNIEQDPLVLANAENYHIPETYLYNLQYLNNGLHKEYSTNPVIDCCLERDTDLIYSLTDNIESKADKWLNFPPLNYQQFPMKDGKFTGIEEIDNYNLFIGFEDAVYVTQQDEGLLTNNGSTLFLGSPDAFKRRLKKISVDAGCSDKNSIVTTKYGVFWGDEKRKKIYNYTSQSTEVLGNMASWFNENLSGAINGEYDPFQKRIYYTFNDCALSFKPEAQGHASFHSWVPQNYLRVANNMLTTNDAGIWKHNTPNDYQSFYGNFEPFEVGYIINNKFKPGVLQSLEVYSEWYTSTGYNEKIYVDGFFDKLLIYNNRVSSGIQDLYIKNNNDLTDYSGIPVSLVEDNVYRINEFKVNTLQQPFLKWDKCMYTHTGEQSLESTALRGKWFKMHLRSTEGNYKKLIQLSNNKGDEIIS